MESPSVQRVVRAFTRVGSYEFDSVFTKFFAYLKKNFKSQVFHMKTFEHSGSWTLQITFGPKNQVLLEARAKAGETTVSTDLLASFKKPFVGQYRGDIGGPNLPLMTRDLKDLLKRYPDVKQEIEGVPLAPVSEVVPEPVTVPLSKQEQWIEDAKKAPDLFVQQATAAKVGDEIVIQCYFDYPGKEFWFKKMSPKYWVRGAEGYPPKYPALETWTAMTVDKILKVGKITFSKVKVPYSGPKR